MISPLWAVPVLLAVLSALSLAATPAACQPIQAAPPFLVGADLSFLPHYENERVVYSDAAGEADLLAIAKRNNWNIVRVRLWVEPTGEPKYRVSDISHVAALGRRVKAAGLCFLLDLHLSDTWADPGQQRKPTAWMNLPFDELERKVESYSREVVAHLVANGAAPDVVQVGNEVKNGLLFGNGPEGGGEQAGGGFWERDKGGIERALRLLAAGARGVRAGAGQSKPQIMLHVPDGQDSGFVRWFFERVQSGNAQLAAPFEFDVIGLSYYPAEPWDKTKGYDAWHLSHLAQTMAQLARAYGKPIFVVETNYPRAGEVRPDVPGAPEFAFSPDGQAAFYRALTQTVRAVPAGLGRGVLLWEPDWLDWRSPFDEKGQALPGVSALGK